MLVFSSEHSWDGFGANAVLRLGNPLLRNLFRYWGTHKVLIPVLVKELKSGQLATRPGLTGVVIPGEIGVGGMETRWW